MGLNYIKQHKEIRDVLISGGDPFCLPDQRLEFILSSLKEIKHLEIIPVSYTNLTLPTIHTV